MIRWRQSITACIFFCVYCSSPPPVLPSFPTRRSSDLLGDAGEVVTGRQMPTGAGGPPGSFRAFGAASGLIDHHVDQDRKSTRLNSSHVAISYAVFCLQKKSRIVQCSHDSSNHMLTFFA